jgi:peptide/nickel transport system permease protein
MVSSTLVSKEVVIVSPSENDQVEADGGSDLHRELFTQVSVSSASRRERFSVFFDTKLLAPLRVAWTDWRARTGIVVLTLYLLMGTIGVLLVPAPQPLETEVFLPPFSNIAYPLGAGASGQGLFRMVVHATPAMLKMIATGSLFSVSVGALIGITAGYRSGTTDRVLMTLTDIVLTLPGLVLIILLAAIYQPESPYLVGIILGIDNWPGLARTVRSQVLSIREEPHIEVARTMGISAPNIMWRNLLTNLMPYLSVNLASSSKRIIFEAAGLYFLGLLPFTALNWGVMLNQAYQSTNFTEPGQLHWILVPMFAITGISLGLLLLAQGMDRVFNVRLRAKHAQTVASDDE